MNAPRPAVMDRLAGLDVLRGLAASSVMAFHYTVEYGGHAAPGPSVIFPYGNFGVDLFFIISGFVIFMTMERSRTLVVFLTFRAARLYPAFLAAMGMTLAAMVLLGTGGVRFGLGTLAANLTMMPALFNADMIDRAYWSLFYELWFYILGGWVYFTFRPRAPELSCGLWLLGSLVLRFSPASHSYGQLVQVTGAPFSQLFVIGIMLYQIHRARVTPATWAVLAMALAMTAFGPHSTLNDLPREGYPVLIAAFAAAVWLATTPRVRFPVSAPLLFLGRISYPLYLVHQAAGFLVIRRLEALGAPPDLAVCVTMGLAIYAAWVVSELVEYPAQTWLRTRYQAWRSRVPYQTDGRIIGVPEVIEAPEKRWG